MGDVVGRLFREFAITLAVAILISAVVSLTLTPMMCARLLRHVPEAEQSAFYRASGRWFDAVIARYGRMLDWVLDRQGATLLVARRHAGAHGAALRLRAQGLLPGAGHRPDPGHLRGAAIGFVCRHGRAPAGARQGGARGSRGREPVLVHRRGRHQHHAQQRPHADQPEAAGGARRRRERGHPPPAGATDGPPGDPALHAAGAGPHHRGPDQPHAVPVHPRDRRPRRALAVDRQAGRAPVAAAAAGQRRLATCRTRACRPSSPSTATPPGAWALPRRRSTTCCTTPSASAWSPPSSPSRTSTGWCSRWSRTSAAGRRRWAISTCPSSAGGQVPLSALAHTSEKPGPAGDQPSRAVSRGDGVLQPRAWLLARRRGRRHPARRAAARHACLDPHQLPGRRARLPRFARQRAAAHSRGDRHHVHRARRALRELHPPGHHPLDAALGWRRRAARPAHRAHRSRRDRHHRHHPADRHRQEERDHDDRLRPRRRAPARARARARRSTRPACCASGRS